MLEELLDATIDGVFLLDTRGRFLYANSAFATILGLPIQRIVGYTSQELAMPAALTSLRFPLSAPTRGEVEFSTMQGPCTFEYTLSPVPTQDRAAGTTEAVVGVVRDIEERKRVEQQHDAFFRLASHELRTPLAALKGNIQLALRQVKRLLKLEIPQASEYVNKIEGMLVRAERQVDVEARMVNDMLDVSRIQNNKLEFHPHRFDLVALVNMVVTNERIVEPSRVIDLRPAEQASCLVFADEARIEQVLGNYLSNALKYAPPEQSIEVAIEMSRTQVCVSVHDEGPGLTPEEQRHVWDRFYQTPGRTVLNGQSTGLGLGLFVCKTFIERQHGTVGVESEKGNGATFWFTLPLIQQDEIE